MEWIRTECGILFTKVNGIDNENVKQYSNNVWHYKGVDKFYKGAAYLNNEILIKKQGSLIECLEVGDIVIPYCNKYDNFDNSVIVSINVEDKFVTTWRYSVILKYQIAKIITHEQYMPLAQEVKDE